MKNLLSYIEPHVWRLYFHDQIILSRDSIEDHEAILQAFENGDKETAFTANLNCRNYQLCIRCICNYRMVLLRLGCK
ncbi:hypothetical protein [Bacillus dakarensis]|uniref:hypothetical protein n=1 Tax=Robertmurraya dakarensis TaxID=1926278 RepID=UPI003B024BED